MYWYCDIIETKINGEEYTFIDLLVDVVIYPNGEYKILDLDELDEAVEKGLITNEKKQEALNKMESLVEQIKLGKFPPEEVRQFE